MEAGAEILQISTRHQQAGAGAWTVDTGGNIK